MCLTRAVAVAAVLLQAALADVNVFPVKSINLGQAPAVDWYNVVGGNDLEDPHAVVGIQTADGGYVMAGKAMECGDVCTPPASASKMDAFASKVASNGSSLWTWTSTNKGANDAVNGVAQLPDGAILVAGYRVVSGVSYRSLTRLDQATGQEQWTFTGFGDASGAHGAWELITNVGTTDVLLAGLAGKADANELAFKSYGNTVGGQAVVMKIPVSELTGSSPPSAITSAWSKTFSGYDTAKGARALPNGDVAVQLWKEDEVNGKTATLQMLNTAGSNKWGPVHLGVVGGGTEGTDFAVSSDGATLAMTGHGGDGTSTQSYSGRLIKVDASDGKMLWYNTYTAGGNPELIFNECWGVVALSDGGHAMSCGAGIEGCDHLAGGVSHPSYADCIAGRGDPRAGAKTFPPGHWASLTIRTDGAGQVKWQRVDQHREQGGAGIDDVGWSATSSAGEWLVVTSDGGLACFQDEIVGYAVLKLSSSSATSESVTAGAQSTSVGVGNDDTSKPTSTSGGGDHASTTTPALTVVTLAMAMIAALEVVPL